MEALFLKILNMSITADYVIIVVILIRLLLKKAPKKYSYLLWSVVLFRMICPVSYSSAFSIFQAKLFDMATAQKDGGAALSFIPADIGYMKTPRVTVGIPTMNSIISGSLPVATPYASINPMQILIFAGMVLWCAGIVILLVYSIITFTRLKFRMATAVRLEGDIFESDKICSPFILGFVKPLIYIPFGLDEQEREYILRHERCHLKRKDYLIKPLSFYVLTIHWFNPLAWLAFVMMTKDMEMSCDEKVLSETASNIIHKYSTSLLSFATNRRFPTASPLAFGETGIRERVKNVLQFREPKKWVVILAVILCASVAIACAANPIANAGIKANDNIYGDYVFEKQVYMNPLSSFIADDGYKEYYTFTGNMLIITENNDNHKRIAVDYEQSEMDEQEFKNSFILNSIGVPDIASYKERHQYTLTDASDSDVYRIYQLDDEIWLARMYNETANAKNSKYFWNIYKIKKFDGEMPMKTTIFGAHDNVEDFLSLQKDFSSGYEVDTCYNITPDYIRENSDYLIFKYDTSCASFLMYEGKVYPLGEWFGGFGVTSMSIADLDGDQKPELYFTYSWGSGLHRSHVAYFDPSAKKIVTFDYTHLNKDMIITENNDGGLSLYSANINKMESFVNFEIEGTKFITDVVYKNGQILLNAVINK